MKPRLLGLLDRVLVKLTLLDFLIVAFFVLLIPGGYYLFKLKPKTPNNGNNARKGNIVTVAADLGLVPVDITVEFRNVHEVVFSSIKAGDKLRDNRDRVVGVVTGVVADKTPDGPTHSFLLRLKVLAKPMPRRRYLFFSYILKLGRANMKIETDRYMLRGGTLMDFQPLAVADSLEAPPGEDQAVKSVAESSGK